MAKANTYSITATDTDGESIFDGERITAMTEKAAWTEALKRAFLKVQEKHRQGYLVGSLATLSVTRL
jgi:hypothetical protein